MSKRVRVSRETATEIVGFFDEYRWLSNFYDAQATDLRGNTWPSVEHGYQAAKSSDPAYQARIRVASYAGAAKRLGSRASIRPDWDDVRVQEMLALVRSKFEDGDLCWKLLATGAKTLIEENDWGDTFWGRCNGRGTNMLGQILMHVRRELQQGKILEFKPTC